MTARSTRVTKVSTQVGSVNGSRFVSRGAGLASALRMAMSRLTRRLRTEHADDWSMHQYSVLARLEEDGPHLVGQLADLERVKSSSMSSTVNHLVNVGLVERASDPDDGRRTRVVITPNGSRALEVDRHLREAWLAERLAQLSKEDQAAVWRAIEIMSQVSEQ